MQNRSNSTYQQMIGVWLRSAFPFKRFISLQKEINNLNPERITPILVFFNTFKSLTVFNFIINPSTTEAALTQSIITPFSLTFRHSMRKNFKPFKNLRKNTISTALTFRMRNPHHTQLSSYPCCHHFPLWFMTLARDRL